MLITTARTVLLTNKLNNLHYGRPQVIMNDFVKIYNKTSIHEPLCNTVFI